MRELNENWNKIAPLTFMFEGNIPKSKWNDASEEIRTFYFGSKNGELNVDDLEILYTDRLFLHGTRTAVLHLAKETTVYPYIFNHWVSGVGFGKLLDEKHKGKIIHGDDGFYAFSGSFFGVSANSDDSEFIEFSKKYVKLLMSFVNTG
jgi:hypothetical protein